MVTEVEVVNHMNDVVLIVSVLRVRMTITCSNSKLSVHTHFFSQGVQNLDFNQGLVMESLFVSDDFDCHWLICLVIKTLKQQRNAKSL